MKADNEIELFKFLKERLESDFGIISNSMVYTLRDICLALPDFVAFFKMSGCGSILAALSLYFEKLQKDDEKEYIFIYLKQKEKKTVLFYLFFGYTFFNAIKLFNKNKLGLNNNGGPPF